MDYQMLFNIAFAIAGFLGGWVLNNLSKTIERLDDDVRAMPHTYVSKDDWREAMKEIREEVRDAAAGVRRPSSAIPIIFQEASAVETDSKMVSVVRAAATEATVCSPSSSESRVNRGRTASSSEVIEDRRDWTEIWSLPPQRAKVE